MLIAQFLNGTPEAYAIVFTGNGEVKKVPISELTVEWHYDAGKAASGGWERDFPVAEDE